MACYENADWQKAAIVNAPLPGLVRLYEYIEKTWPGGTLLGIHYDRPIRGGTAPSLHAEGRALDWRYANPGPGRTVVDAEILPLLTRECEVLGIQGIGDYAVPSADGVDGWFWKRCRAPDGSGIGWRRMADSSTGWGQEWANWLHIEMDWDAAKDNRTIEERLGTSPTPQPPTPTPTPPVQEAYLIGMKTIRKGDSGDCCYALQDLLNRRIGAGLPCDGKFGQMTEDALKRYQQTVAPEAGPVDGIAGDKVWNRIGH